MHPSQYLPCGHQLLNGGGWWEPFSIEAALVVRRLVDAFHAENTEHRQTPRELCQFIPAQDRVGFRAACHGDQISKFAVCSLRELCIVAGVGSASTHWVGDIQVTQS